MPIVRGKDIEVLFSASAIARRNLELAKDIAEHDYHDLLVISVLKGSFIFAADLIRAMHDVGLSPEVEFIFISSYGAGTTSGEVRVLRDIDNEVAGRDVLLIDDILESGKTLSFARDLMLSRGARSCAIAVLLDKRMRRKTELDADYVGFDCPDYFVVGYGMDVAHAFRELPFVGVVKGCLRKASDVSNFQKKSTFARHIPAHGKALIVEDDESVRTLAARALERAGHAIDTAADGAQGLAMIEAAGGGYDLVVSDIRMPEMDGIEMAIAASGLFPAMKILLMTGYADQRERAEELNGIIIDVVQKPFTLAEIRSRVDQALACFA